jgi:glyoxylase-like metal-dependent hydrolase (beta-lactamase superfamily II)
MGDTDVVTQYSDYKDYSGVKFPSRIRQSQGGSPVLDVQVSDVQVNPASDIAVPELVRAAAERAVAEKAAEGVWFIGGGSHNSVAIEMKDHIMLVESPLYDGRAAAVLAEVKRVIPGKAIRYVVNSHHHFDHAGGLRTAVADGATVVASAKAAPYFQRVLSNPNRINPDLLAKSGAAVKVEGVDGKRVYSDGARAVEVHLIGQSVHADGFIMVYLPKEKLLVQADAYTPLPPGTAPPATPNANHLNLISNIEGLRLSVDRILPLHGRMVPLGELYTTAGRKL